MNTPSTVRFPVGDVAHIPSVNPHPTYITTTFKDISKLLDTIGTSRTLVLMECEEAYALLGSLLLSNQDMEYIILKEREFHLDISNGYIIVLDNHHYVNRARDTLYIYDISRKSL